MDIKDCENLLCHYEQVVLTLYECHKDRASIYKRISSFLSILNIIFGTITGTSSISIYNNNRPGYQLLNIVLVYMITILSAFQKIADPSKKYERFRNASEHYLSLFYEIKYNTTFEMKTEEELKNYVKQLNLKLEDMRGKMPFINDKTYDNYKQKTLQKTLQKSKSFNISIPMEAI